jgi:hypothetical protein
MSSRKLHTPPSNIKGEIDTKPSHDKSSCSVNTLSNWQHKSSRISAPTKKIYIDKRLKPLVQTKLGSGLLSPVKVTGSLNSLIESAWDEFYSSDEEGEPKSKWKLKNNRFKLVLEEAAIVLIICFLLAQKGLSMARNVAGKCMRWALGILSLFVSLTVSCVQHIPFTITENKKATKSINKFVSELKSGRLSTVTTLVKAEHQVNVHL